MFLLCGLFYVRTYDSDEVRLGSTLGLPEVCESPDQANNFKPLKTDII